MIPYDDVWELRKAEFYFQKVAIGSSHEDSVKQDSVLSAFGGEWRL